MSNLTTESVLKVGGKVWEKGAMKRIYLTVESCKAIIKQATYSAMEEKSLKKAKTYFDTNTSELKSDVGTVRSLFNQHGFKCVK